MWLGFNFGERIEHYANKFFYIYFFLWGIGMTYMILSGRFVFENINNKPGIFILILSVFQIFSAQMLLQLIRFVKLSDFSKNVLCFVGKNSLKYYVLHFVVVYLFSKISRYGIISFSVCFIGCMILPMIVDRLSSKNEFSWIGNLF